MNISFEQMAYALLWRSPSDSTANNIARHALLDILSKEQQREAVTWVLEKFGPMSEMELIAADMRAGVFPKRSAS